ncbi:MAG: DsbA family protein [Alphaproteobacteria bacterium]|nr:DsbA family protein [Alphaproteobacteria bacterium]
MAARVLGNPNAPIKVDEFVSLTCPHCADFTNETLPTIEKDYIDTGKVKFVMHDFPLDGISLKAAAVARCMPVDEYFPFIKVLYKNQMTWAYGSADPVASVAQYAELGGLPADQAKACANDSKLQDAIVAERTEATDKYKVNATPTFVINDGAKVIEGAQNAQTFAAAFDQILAAKK